MCFRRKCRRKHFIRSVCIFSYLPEIPHRHCGGGNFPAWNEPLHCLLWLAHPRKESFPFKAINRGWLLLPATLNLGHHLMVGPAECAHCCQRCMLCIIKEKKRMTFSRALRLKKGVRRFSLPGLILFSSIITAWSFVSGRMFVARFFDTHGDPSPQRGN